jgi:hypothetical protein
MDWYVFKRAIVNILILAGPGVCWVISLLMNILGSYPNWFNFQSTIVLR